MGRLNTLDEWLNWQENLHQSVIDLSLERVKIVYNKLFPIGVPFKVITVGGTNGKGSTVAFIDSVYAKSKHKVGRFTSPHLIDYNERFAINAKLVSNAMIVDAFEKIEAIRGNVSITYFEFSTLASLQIFADAGIDIAILEVGLGGRLDSVNVVDSDICVITNIDIDHTDYLGDTRELIGHEKAGIMRSNKLCICGDDNPPKTLIDYGNKINALLEFVKKPYAGKIALEGSHQKHNAAIALRVIEELQPQFPVTNDLIRHSFENTNIIARFQKITVGKKHFILDVAHNSAAVAKLTYTLKKDKVEKIAIFSALADKNIDAMINLAKDTFTHWFLVPLNVERAIQIELLHSKFENSMNTTVCKDMQEAIASAMTLNNAKRIVIFGSFHTIADATLILKKLSSSFIEITP